MEDILQIEHISKTYRNEDHPFQAARDISLTLHKGEMMGIVGLSGSGKSTVLRMAGRLEIPDEGTVLSPWKEDFYRHGQMVFQDPLEAFSPRMTIHEFLMEPLLNFRLFSEKEGPEKIGDILKETGLPEEVLPKLPHQLSGGQLQRIVIARALLIHPELILFDEPTSALDVVTQDRILQLIRKEREKFHFAGLFVSHDLAVVQEIADTVLVMDRGRVVERLPAKDLRKGIHPATRQLIEAQLPEDGRPIPSVYEKGIAFYDGNSVKCINNEKYIKNIFDRGVREVEITIKKDHSLLAYCFND